MTAARKHIAPLSAVPSNGSDGQADAIELSVVMPCLNEAETLEVCVKKALGFMEEAGVAGEVIVADNGSTDGSQELAESLGARVVHVKERGYGAALMGGFQAARGKYVVMGDADDSYDFSGLAPFLERLRAGDELVMGNRFQGGIAKGAMPKLHYYFGNPFLTLAGRTLFQSPIGDFQCGLRAFHREAMLGVGLRTKGMEFASEMVVKSSLAKLRIAEVPTTLSPDGRSRPPHLRSWRDGWRNMRFLLAHSPRWLYFVPGLTLLALGLALFAMILPGTFRLFGVNLDLHSLAAGAGMIVLGTQMVTFGILAKQVGERAGMLPPSDRLEKVKNFWQLERAIGFGAGLFLLGLALMIFAAADWGTKGLGNLDYGTTMRVVLPAVTLMVVGVQIVMSGFITTLLDFEVAPEDD